MTKILFVLVPMALMGAAFAVRSEEAPARPQPAVVAPAPAETEPAAARDYPATFTQTVPLRNGGARVEVAAPVWIADPYRLPK